jgi:hypothetical protein
MSEGKKDWFDTKKGMDNFEKFSILAIPLLILSFIYRNRKGIKKAMAEARTENPKGKHTFWGNLIMVYLLVFFLSILFAIIYTLINN